MQYTTEVNGIHEKRGRDGKKQEHSIKKDRHVALHFISFPTTLTESDESPRAYI